MINERSQHKLEEIDKLTRRQVD